jgi:hypothetical protein
VRCGAQRDTARRFDQPVTAERLPRIGRNDSAAVGLCSRNPDTAGIRQLAPHDTDIRREARRHRVPLIGMAVLVAPVLVGFFWWVGRATLDRNAVPATEDAPAAAEPAN